MTATETPTPQARAMERAKYLSGLVWHAGTFVIINAFLWAIDSMGYGGVNWAYWVTIGWGLALAFHALAYFVDGRQLEERKSEEYLDEMLRHKAEI